MGRFMLRSVAIATLVSILAAVSVVVLVEWGRNADALRSAHRASVAEAVAIEAVRLEPPGDPTVETECASLAWVDFTYRVSNRGNVPIDGLTLGAKCACEEIGEPTETILPGDSGLIRFRLRGPYVGRLEKNVTLIMDGRADPIAVFHVSLRVSFEPPKLVPLSDSFSLSYIAGDRSPRELLFEAIEAKRAQPWICGLKLNLDDELDVQPHETETLPEPDPDLVRRRYHFPIANRSLPHGARMVTAAIQTRPGSATVRDSIAIWVNVLDRIAIVPNPLVIKCGAESPPSSGRVRVVVRTGDKAPIVPHRYERDRLRIEAVGQQAGSTAVFDVVPINAGNSAGETRVVFNIGDTESNDLVVRLEPSEGR